MARLIVIRGNSGAGKSTVAQELRKTLLKNGRPRVALVEQDYLRINVLNEQEGREDYGVELTYTTVSHILSMGYDVILEGVLKRRYKKMVNRLLEENQSSYLFYLNVSLKETIKRHRTKSSSHEFGAQELAAWYSADDLLDREYEVIFDESMSARKMVSTILDKIK